MHEWTSTDIVHVSTQHVSSADQLSSYINRSIESSGVKVYSIRSHISCYSRSTCVQHGMHARPRVSVNTTKYYYSNK